jgi:protein O-GlcNAcase/histone acetyltransferase
MEAWGMNTYLYGPKDDVKVRTLWRVPYSDEEARELRGLIAACGERGLTFVYALGPGLDMTYVSPEDGAALEAKVEQLLQLGVEHFTLLFDDIPHTMSTQDEATFASFAEAQCAVTNRFFDHQRRHVPEGRLFFCPTDYCGRMAKPNVLESSYLQEIGERLHPEIDIFWTGPEIVSETIPVPTVLDLQTVLRRKPLIWENLHANDYDIRRIYLGPFAGRELALRDEVVGVLSNPNNEFEANFVPLWTLAEYAKAQGLWRPKDAYRRAVEAWLPRFAKRGGEPFTVAEVEQLGELFYLPFTLGGYARSFLDEARLLLSSSIEVNRRQQGLLRLEQTVREVTALFDKLKEIENRELLYTLYSYLWEVRQELAVVAGYLSWSQRAKVPAKRFARPHPLPNTYRGGLVAELQRLLPLDDEGGVAHERSQLEG